MTEKLEIPWETKYKFAVGGYHAAIKGLLELIGKEYGGDAALKIFEKYCKKDDRVKNLTGIIQNVFKIEGNDLEAIDKWWTIWHEITGMESTVVEQSKTLSRNKITKCPWKTESKDISDWELIFTDIVYKALNPKVNWERTKAMCEGDPYCEFVEKLEE